MAAHDITDAQRRKLGDNGRMATQPNQALQTYIDNIEAKTGKKIAVLTKEVQAKTFAKVGEAVAWLKEAYGLGHGHANYVAQRALNGEKISASGDDKLAGHFSGEKAKWRAAYDALVKKVAALGTDVAIAPNRSYVNLQRGGKKFGIVQISSAERIDIGIKLKGVAADGRLEAAGSWNAMVTHRVRIAATKEIDKTVLSWLKQAYDAAA
jgi:Domain of unknown function (DUF4287)/Domain of unknown function (DUF5655)